MLLWSWLNSIKESAPWLIVRIFFKVDYVLDFGPRGIYVLPNVSADIMGKFEPTAFSSNIFNFAKLSETSVVTSQVTLPCFVLFCFYFHVFFFFHVFLRWDFFGQNPTFKNWKIVWYSVFPAWLLALILITYFEECWKQFCFSDLLILISVQCWTG